LIHASTRTFISHPSRIQVQTSMFLQFEFEHHIEATIDNTSTNHIEATTDTSTNINVTAARIRTPYRSNKRPDSHASAHNCEVHQPSHASTRAFTLHPKRNDKLLMSHNKTLSNQETTLSAFPTTRKVQDILGTHMRRYISQFMH
jgi:cytoskeletal protein RodZ